MKKLLLICWACTLMSCTWLGKGQKVTYEGEQTKIVIEDDGFFVSGSFAESDVTIEIKDEETK